jgi:hypothetical protein
MNMLDRYLYAVQQALPKSEQRDDIIAEIGDELQSQIDERQAQLGRPLTGDEEAAIIKAYGHPRLVAGRYAKVPYLIGPELLPFYWYVLRFTLTIGLTIIIVGGALIAVAAKNMQYFFDGINAAWSSLFYIAGVVTIIFAVYERVRANTPLDAAIASRWDPRRLPAPPGPGALEPVSPFESAAGFLCSTITLLVLVNVQILLNWLSVAILGPLGIQINVVSWLPLYAAAIVAAIAIATIDVIAFLRPSITPIRIWVQIGANVVILIGQALTLARPPWILPAHSFLNEVSLYVLVAAIAIQVIQLAVALYKLVAPRHSQKVALS